MKTKDKIELKRLDLELAEIDAEEEEQGPSPADVRADRRREVVRRIQQLRNEDKLGETERWVIAYGNPVDGFNYIGPFGSHDDAVEETHSVDRSESWWIVPLCTPDLETSWAEQSEEEKLSDLLASMSIDAIIKTIRDVWELRPDELSVLRDGLE